MKEYRYRVLTRKGEPVYIAHKFDREGDLDPNTAALLVGYDADGEEVYEGDILVDDKGREWAATLSGRVVLPKFYSDNPFYDSRFTGRRLRP